MSQLDVTIIIFPSDFAFSQPVSTPKKLLYNPEKLINYERNDRELEHLIK